MRKWMLKFVLPAPLFLVLLPGQTCAQSFNATIRGMITEPSGAAIPGAKLTLRALSTNTTAKERQGDFSDWADSTGNLIPVYDPATTRAHPACNPGQGPRMSNLRGFGYHNQDLSLMKNTPLTERVGIQFRAEFFNVWNWHVYDCTSECEGTLAFVNDVSSPSFGMWNGEVSPPLGQSGHETGNGRVRWETNGCTLGAAGRPKWKFQFTPSFQLQDF